jgi:hypothetical protein
MAGLLGADALRGLRIAISVSASPDLDRLGLMEAHFRLTVGELARAVLVSGGTLAYGGHLDPAGYTAFLVAELQRYTRRDRPLLVSLPWQEHRGLALSELGRRQRAYGQLARVVCLDRDGTPMIDPSEGREEQAVAGDDIDHQTRRSALTQMRRYQVAQTDGRVLIGGRRADFQGDLPGLMEEALLTLEARQPLYLAGGFGGVTVDIIRALGIDDAGWLPHDSQDGNEDSRVVRGRALLHELGTRPPPNGLTEEENRRLATTHRPSEVASLVALGLGRLRNPESPTRSGSPDASDAT